MNLTIKLAVFLIASFVNTLGVVKTVQLQMKVTRFDGTVGRSSNTCNITYGTNDGSLSGTALLVASFPEEGTFISFMDMKLDSEDFKNGFPDIKDESINWASPENVLKVFVKAGYEVTAVYQKSKRGQYNTEFKYEYYLRKEIP